MGYCQRNVIEKNRSSRFFFLHSSIHIHRLLRHKKNVREEKRDCLSMCTLGRSTNKKMFRSTNRKREENNNHNTHSSLPWRNVCWKATRRRWSIEWRIKKRFSFIHTYRIWRRKKKKENRAFGPNGFFSTIVWWFISITERKREKNKSIKRDSLSFLEIIKTMKNSLKPSHFDTRYSSDYQDPIFNDYPGKSN